MIERGKYQSLTMINWNGFFARTFDIDELVTTLSGGNGAGKSTTMAAFITALIPDQSLLHFRNTTEAGSSQASRDKGLYGKLQAGVCYTMLDVVNSRKQRLLFGVKLQQVASRDKKVDIKPFLIEELPSDVKPTDILIKQISATKAKVSSLNEVRERLAKYPQAQFKVFNSVSDYHSCMFDFGVIPKKLRGTSDRSKFYRLIEASLYGGISSTITRSLRDYLLPENGGVKKAFQDMGSALHENRMTLEAIKTTQADRDLFKHLLAESTSYVAADYMRHANDRRVNIEQALAIKAQLLNNHKHLLERNEILTNTKLELELLVQDESLLEENHQAAIDHLQLVQNALRQQEKIMRYQDELLELSERLEEQYIIAKETEDRYLELDESYQASENEVDSLKSQLADHQQALDAQQTRAILYQQAKQALIDVRTLLNNENLELSDVSFELATYKEQEALQTTALLSLKHKLDLSTASAEQFERALSLVSSIVGENILPVNASAQAKIIIDKMQDAKQQVASEFLLQSQQSKLQANLDLQAKVNKQILEYQEQFGVTINSKHDLTAEQQVQQMKIDELEIEQENLRNETIKLRYDEQNIEDEIKELTKIAPKWLQANDALEDLTSQLNNSLENDETNAIISLSNNAQFMAQMQNVLEREKDLAVTKDQLMADKKHLEQQIEQLNATGGVSDPRLKQIAETLGGVLLTEIYDDVNIDDAPYFSAMYGPARSAIVVSDLTDIEEKLLQLDDCPEDIYLIEGDVDAFDDSSFNVQEVANAVCVRINERQMRYSRFPKISLFGRAAREMRLAKLRTDRDKVNEQYAKIAFDGQKMQRLYQNFNNFVVNYLDVAFMPNPERSLAIARDRRNKLQSALTKFDTTKLQLKDNIQKSKQALDLLQQLLMQIHITTEQNLSELLAQTTMQLEQVYHAKRFIKEHSNNVEKLLTLANVLDAPPDQFVSLQAEYQNADQILQDLKKKIFALEDLFERRHYFAYSDAIVMIDQNSELSQQLKDKLEIAQQERVRFKENAKQASSAMNKANELLATLKTSYQIKQTTITEFEQELQDFGVQVTDIVLEKALTNRNQIQQNLHVIRTRKTEHERTITTSELEVNSLGKQLKKMHKEYIESRTKIIASKSSWGSALHLAREHNVERRLNKRELAYLSDNQLRSMSDKALGSLRLAVANNELLRDALRSSEDSRYPEKKILFYICVYQHLKERIRQDIIQSDDPIEAIEEMEVELARLTEELSLRESRLAISASAAAQIIKKTILREQNRIRMLNQGLSNIAFGQVNGVRLNVKIRETHDVLLNNLAANQDEHKDLFESSRLTFSESMAKLFTRVNPHVDLGQRSPQIFGEELLDYRNYLELSIEVNRGSDGWLQAESGALSTGEAIGTGQSILLMVVQSWEEEARRLRNKDIIPCRLLFLDEAARLDAKSISTLFELCNRLDMQLLIAAPENISPEKGTTYKLMRKVFKDHEHVHVVGLRGFAA